ncbi:TatD family hydrolase [Halarchaeum sp. CBA1220]|uniref:TatD family hydrolase n=1 Tax=Halarchaeum sp. CBA1220 TaxID=1853682 RepID=UPI000F3A9234|nr:TatD family hydrolase [Halarchaeum sp. CBA1220]QLC32801.1 TatD family hydrolase [Halarchaeum sp. CBA1220]
MRDLGTPVLDDHLHLDPRHARGIDAVTDFARSGGTHLLVVNKPSWHLGVEADTGEDFRAVFEETLDVVADASEELRGRAWPVLGVHPGLVSRLVDERGFDADEAAELMCAGLDVAAEHAADGEAVALKSGRPHYDVSESVWDASNRVLRHALERAAETGVALQLHTEATEDLTDVAAWAEDAGLPPERVVKHYASGECAGVTPSVMCEKGYLEDAVASDGPFLMETDYVDDPERPGAVMGPKTVPRRVNWLLENGHEAAVERAHVETPEAVYGIDTAGTLE